MGAIDSVLFTNKSASLTPATPSPGDSNVIRSFPLPYRAHLLAVMQSLGNASAAFGCISETKSPRLHDAAHGIHIENANLAAGGASEGGQMILMCDPPNPLQSQDTIEVDLQGDGVVFDNLLWLNFYENLPGVELQRITRGELNMRTQNTGGNKVGVRVNLTTTVGSGQWEGGVPINSVYDTLKANKNYAFLGATAFDSAGLLCPFVVSIKSSDTGNLRLAVPISGIQSGYSSRFYTEVDKTFGIEADPVNKIASSGFIPVFNAANKGSMTCEIASSDAGGNTYNAVYWFQELD